MLKNVDGLGLGVAAERRLLNGENLRKQETGKRKSLFEDSTIWKEKPYPLGHSPRSSLVGSNRDGSPRAKSLDRMWTSQWSHWCKCQMEVSRGEASAARCLRLAAFRYAGLLSYPSHTRLLIVAKSDRARPIEERDSIAWRTRTRSRRHQTRTKSED